MALTVMLYGSGIGCDIAPANPGSHRGDGNDAPPALLYQPRYERLGHVVDAGQVDREHTLPEFIRVVEEFMAASVACIIDQDIYSAKPLDQGGGHVFYLLGIGYIAWHR